MIKRIFNNCWTLKKNKLIPLKIQNILKNKKEHKKEKVGQKQDLDLKVKKYKCKLKLKIRLSILSIMLTNQKNNLRIKELIQWQKQKYW